MSPWAVAAVVLLGIICAFQLALAGGAPWGAAAWGGQHTGTLPPPYRVASGVMGGLIYPALGLAVLEADTVVDVPALPDLGPTALWWLAGLFAIGAVANLASRSRIEKWWALAAGALAVSFAAMALG